MKNQITIKMIEAEISEINGAIALLNPEFIYFKDTQQILRSDKTEKPVLLSEPEKPEEKL